MKRTNQHTPAESLNKAYLRLKPHRAAIELFKANLITLLDGINEAESEEFHKNLVSRFLTDTYYGSNHFINTKGRNDLVIHNGKDARSSLGVIIEAKKPTNRAEMIRPDALNAKALQELLLYYLRERITARNLELKYLVATNIYEWMVFDAQLFERLFATDKTLVQQFTDFEKGRLGGSSTDFFYRQIASPAIEKTIAELEFTHFDIRHFDTPLRNNRPDDDAVLIPLFKTFSPEHLLKLPFANDSNSLDRGFYNELLHIIGLGEVKEGGKKTIQRKETGKREMGSLLENAITQLDRLDKLSRLPNLKQYGNTTDERLFSVAMELIITWINQILFLKLLEAQLIGYHKGDKRFAILTPALIHNYDDLNNLFFGVLAKRPEERREDVKNLFAHVPYLNSSLFEPTEMEHNTLFISNLTELQIPVHPATVLKDANGHRIGGQMETLAYLFAFLDAYDFTSEGADEIQEENKTLINASVLGLIFEKINGYKDGSFFTPGFITMYMARETLRRAVVQKFNEAKAWDCTEFDQLYDKITDKQEANTIINSLKICDPAVGSGHFLVSCLNEMIAIKSELKVLLDRQGKTLRDYAFEVVNDELIVTDDDAGLFAYNPTNKETQRVQETLFHEKQTIIENCLFGVDINSNSVKICRLRLWIELLKNAYYKEGTTDRQLETLPNIDINIKCGNSLVSRFALDADMSKALKKSRWSIDSYRIAVMTYRNAKSKEEKRAMVQLINQIKNDFETEIAINDKRLIRLNKIKGDLLTLSTQTSMFELTKTEKVRWNKQVEQLTIEINKLEAELEAIKSNRIYENALEWRFEFPEVLNEQGDFVGFDVLIGNPPYIRTQDIKSNPSFFDYLSKSFQSPTGNFDIYVIFIELATYLTKRTTGLAAYIVPHKFLNSQYGKGIREFLRESQLVKTIISFKENLVFEDVSTYTCLLTLSKKNSVIDYHEGTPNDIFFPITFKKVNYDSIKTGSNWILNHSDDNDIFTRLKSLPKTVESYFRSIRQGIATSADDIFILRGNIQEGYFIGFNQKGEDVFIEKEMVKPFLKGDNVWRYSSLTENLYILFPYILDARGEVLAMTYNQIEALYPHACLYMNRNKNLLENREREKFKNENHWFLFSRNQGLKFMENNKLIVRNFSYYSQFTIDYQNHYHNTNVYSLFLKEEISIDIKVFLGIFNSKLMWYYMKSTSPVLRGGFVQYKTTYMLPFPLPDLDINSENVQKIMALVSRRLELDGRENEMECKSIEEEIDVIVYNLYGLSSSDIAGSSLE